MKIYLYSTEVLDEVYRITFGEDAVNIEFNEIGSETVDVPIKSIMTIES